MNALEIKVVGVPAKLEANFGQVQAALEVELKKYDVLVTADTLADAKKLATELNKMAGHIDTLRKNEVAKASAPVREFDARMKELVGMCKTGRTKLTGQIETFNAQTLKECQYRLELFRGEQWEHFKVEPEFRQANIQDLVIVSNLTATGNLTSKACNDVVFRVTEDNHRQRLVEDRLAMLDTAALNVGLDAPLVRAQVDHFLLDGTDEEYKARLGEVASQVKATQDQAEARMRERMEREQAAKLEAERAKLEAENDVSLGEMLAREKTRIRDEAMKEARAKLEAEKPPESPPQGMHPSAIPTTPHVPQRVTARQASLLRRVVTVVFHVDAPPGVSSKRIEEQLLVRMQDAGFKRVASITVE